MSLPSQARNPSSTGLIASTRTSRAADEELKSRPHLIQDSTEESAGHGVPGPLQRPQASVTSPLDRLQRLCSESPP